MKLFSTHKEKHSYILTVLIFASLGLIPIGFSDGNPVMPWVGVFLAVLFISLYVMISNRKEEKIQRFMRKELEQVEVELDPEISWQAYENLVQKTFIAAGLKAELTPAGADRGIDVIATYKGMKIGIQVKHLQTRVTSKVVGEVRSGMDWYDCEYGCIVTTKGYTYPCEEQARKSRVGTLLVEDIEGYVDDIKNGRI